MNASDLEWRKASGVEQEMVYLVAAVWAVGALFLVARYLNNLRLVLNNFTQMPRHSDFANVTFLSYRIWMSKIDPKLLTETGRAYLKVAIRDERIFHIWLVLGFPVVIWLSTYLVTS